MIAADPSRHNAAAVEHWTRLVRSEYQESPGLRLTWRQVQRFWGLDQETCRAVLDVLTSEQFLKKTHTDAYARADVW